MPNMFASMPAVKGVEIGDFRQTVLQRLWHSSFSHPAQSEQVTKVQICEAIFDNDTSQQKLRCPRLLWHACRAKCSVAESLSQQDPTGFQVSLAALPDRRRS